VTGYDYVQDTEPSGPEAGETWFDTGTVTGKVWTGSTWVEESAPAGGSGITLSGGQYDVATGSGISVNAGAVELDLSSSVATESGSYGGNGYTTNTVSFSNTYSFVALDTGLLDADTTDFGQAQSAVVTSLQTDVDGNYTGATIDSQSYSSHTVGWFAFGITA
jgi:hypothetical protein